MAESFGISWILTAVPTTLSRNFFPILIRGLLFRSLHNRDLSKPYLIIGVYILKSKAMNDVKEQFSNVSKRYDSQRKYLIPCFNDFYTACLPLVKSLTHARSVLDIGAGTGLFSQFIYDFNPKLNFTLIDISGEMLDVAKE